MKTRKSCKVQLYIRVRRTDGKYDYAAPAWNRNRKLLGDSAAVTVMLDRLLHHGPILKCGPRSWRTKTGGAGAAQ